MEETRGLQNENFHEQVVFRPSDYTITIIRRWI